MTASSGVGYHRFLDLTEQDLKLLRSRAVEMAKRIDDKEASDRVELLEITSRGQTFAIPLGAVEGITDLTSIASVPRSPPFVRGLVSFRGEVLIGIELSTLVGSGDLGFADLRRVICIVAGRLRIAILAERVVSVRSVALSVFKADPLGQHPFVLGTDDHFISLLEPGMLISYAFKSVGDRR